MIHATLADGTTMLFAPTENVVVAEWVEGGYYAGMEEGPAETMVKPGKYVLEREGANDDGEPTVGNDSPILFVREI